MPPPRKIDLLPDELREWLTEELKARGFAEIVDVTDALNARMQEAGLELSIGKSAVGDFSRVLKDQREAFAFADAMLSDLDIEQEGELHRALMQMIGTSAMQMMVHVRNEDGHLDPKDLMSLGRMLKDLMGSAGLREKLLQEERLRIAKEAREAALAEVSEVLDQAAEAEPGLTGATLKALKRDFLGIRT